MLVHPSPPRISTDISERAGNTRSYRGQSSGEEFSPTRDSTRNSVKLRRNNFSSHPRPSSSARLILTRLGFEIHYEVGGGEKGNSMTGGGNAVTASL